MDTVVQGLLKALALLFSFDREFYSIVFLSLTVSGMAVVIAGVLGVPLGAAVALRQFPGRGLLVTILNTLMGLPPVVAGLVVYLILSRSGPLGFLGLLYSPTAMVIAQTAIVTPIIAALTWSAVASVDRSVRETALTLGANGFSVDLRVLAEARVSVVAALVAGFGRAMAEVGAVLMVGGNIAGYTRVMTTAIAMETGKGGFELAIALGFVLLLCAFLVNLALSYAQGRGSTV